MWRAPRPTAHRGPPPACLQFCTSTTGSSHRWVRTNGANDGAQGMKESLGCHAADSALLTCPAPSAVEVHHSAVGWWGTMRGAGWWWGATTDNAYASWTGSGHLRGLCMQPFRLATLADGSWGWMALGGRGASGRGTLLAAAACTFSTGGSSKRHRGIQGVGEGEGVALAAPVHTL